MKSMKFSGMIKGITSVRPGSRPISPAPDDASSAAVDRHEPHSSMVDNAIYNNGLLSLTESQVLGAARSMLGRCA